MPPTPRFIEGASPGEVPEAALETGALNTGSASSIGVKQVLPFICLLNTDTVAHTITASARATSGVGTSNPAFSLPAGRGITLPTMVFASITDATLNGKVFWWYSDVPVAFPSAAAGGGLATSVATAALGNFTPSDNTERMAGYGSTLKITPLATGIVRFTVSGMIFRTQTAGANNTLAGRYGTGSAPTSNSAASGTRVPTSGGLIASDQSTLGTKFPFCFSVVVSGLTIGTAYWFDLTVILGNTGDGNIQNVFGDVEELPA